MPTILPYGAWPSPITARADHRHAGGPGQPLARRGDGLLDREPAARGRPGDADCAAARRRARGADAGTVQPAHPRARVWRPAVHRARRRWSSASSSRTSGSIASRPERAPVPLTPESGGKLRYADLVLDLPRRRVLAVREDHRGDGEPVNTLVAVPLDGRPARGRGAGRGPRLLRLPAAQPGRQPARLAELGPSGHALGSAPRSGSPSSTRPGRPGEPVADRDRAPEESLVQPEWSPDGQLHVMSDRSDFWSLYRVDGRGLGAGGAARGRARRARSGSSGARWYDFLDEDTVLAIATRARPLAAGRHRSGDRRRRRRSTCRSSSMPGVSCAEGRAVVQALPDDGPAVIALLDATAWHRRSPRPARSIFDPALIARAEHVDLPEQRRPPGLRALLSADQSGLRGARRASCRRWSCAAMAAPPAAPRRP